MNRFAALTGVELQVRQPSIEQPDENRGKDIHHHKQALFEFKFSVKDFLHRTHAQYQFITDIICICVLTRVLYRCFVNIHA